MKIELELFEDCSTYEIEDIDSVCWQLKINGKDAGALKTYSDIHKLLDIIFDLEETDILKDNKINEN